MRRSFFVTIKLVEKDSSHLIDIFSYRSHSRANEAFKDELLHRSSALGFKGFNYLFNCPKNETAIACLFDGFSVVVSLVTIDHIRNR